MDAGRADFLGKYRAISAKLKKRFLRKPNVAEASAQFGALAKELENQECPHYAAFCLLAVARCEHTLGNAIAESQTLVQAARLFLEAEELNHELLCPGFSENFNAALSCYNHAVKAYIDQNQLALATALCLEVGNALQHLGRHTESIPHYQKAAELQSYCPLDYLSALKLLSSCKIKIGDYHGALFVLTEMISIAQEKGVGADGKRVGAFSSILADAEILSVLLLLLLQPVPQNTKPEHAKLLEKYAWETSDSDSSVNYISEDVFLLLQSVVMACQSQDTKALKALESDLWRHLSPEQNDLLHEVIIKATK